MAQTRKSTKPKKTATKKKASAAAKKTAASASKKTATNASQKPATNASKKAASGEKAGGKTPPARKTSPAARKKTASRRAAGKAPAAEKSDLPELALVHGLADIVREYGLEELAYDSPDVTVTLKRASGHAAEPAVVAAVPAATPASPALNLPALDGAPMLIASPPPAPPPDPNKFLERSGAESDEEFEIVKSPFVGTFYRRPGPDTEPYVTLGERVSKGQVLCIVEAMKLMNEIECDVSGRIADILVEDAQPVEYGQPLFKITHS